MIDIRKTAAFSRWMAGLRDHRARAKIAARIDRLAFGNPGDVRPVGEGVSELRIHEGGGDKDTQAKDIAKAKTLAAGLES